MSSYGKDKIIRIEGYLSSLSSTPPPKIEMAVDDALNYRFKANLKYPKLDIDEESMDVRIKILESSQLEMEATKGAESEGMAEFVVNGYDVAVTFTKD